MPPKRKPVGKPKRTVPRSPKVKRDLLKEYAASINKKGVVEVLSLSDDTLSNVKTHISTQSVTLDRLLNGKGYPTGRVTEIYGPPHLGKSTLLDHAFAEVQRMKGVGILFDTETSRDIHYTSQIGVDPKKLQVVEFTRENSYVENIMNKLYDTVDWWAINAPDTPVVIGWDALGGTSTKDELNKRLVKEEKMAGAAKILRSASRQLPPKLGGTNIAVIIINHVYDTIGGQYKSKQTYGGAGVRHLATIRIKLSPMFNGWLNPNDRSKGRFVEAYLEKNRLGKAYRSVKTAIVPGVGIDNVCTLFEALKELGCIATKGSWSAINLDGEDVSFQGLNGFVEKCMVRSELFNKLVWVYNNSNWGK